MTRRSKREIEHLLDDLERDDADREAFSDVAEGVTAEFVTFEHDQAETDPENPRAVYDVHGVDGVRRRGGR